MVIEWETVALPILKTLEDPQDHHVREGFFQLGHGTGGQALGLDLDDGTIHDGLLALRDVGYIAIDDIQYEGSGGCIVLGARVTGRGLQVLGQWPSHQAALSPATLEALLTGLKDYAPDEETRQQIEKAADTVAKKSGNAVRQVVVSFGTAALKKRLGLG